jgi:hypothetical protein
VLEDHIRLHLLSPGRKTANPQELAEIMIDPVRCIPEVTISDVPRMLDKHEIAHKHTALL